MADTDRSLRSAPGTGTAWWVLLAAIPLALATVVGLRYQLNFVGADFDVYRGGARAVLSGDRLYDFSSANQLPFTYPPAAALLFVPLGPGRAAVTDAGWTFLSVSALQAVVWVTIGRLGVTARVDRLRRTAVASLLVLPLAPVEFNLWVGQINIFLLLLVLADLFLNTGRFRGVAIGIAAGIKLTPLIFIAYLLLTRRLRAAATATAAFAATVLVGFLLLPGESARYWSKYAADVGRITLGNDVPYFDASLRGVLGRLDLPALTATYFVLGGLVGAAGLALSVWASRRGQEVVGVLACGITGLLVSPVSWIFHWVWIVPLLLLWAHRASERGRTRERAGVAALYLLCLSSAGWVVLLFLQVSVPLAVTQVYAALYTVIGAATLVVFAVHLRRTGGSVTELPTARRADPDTLAA